MVQFIPGTRPDAREYPNPCNAPPPAGYTFTADGRPHVIKTPYTPNTHYNPISLANFIRIALRSQTLSDADRLCFGLLGAEHLLSGKIVRTTRDASGHLVKSAWFPYPFEFSANPAVPPLASGWYSGLGQGAAMSALMELGDVTGDQHWYDEAAQIFESYHVPYPEGFTNRSNGFLWFEEYPTAPPTVVFNGHFQAVISLDAWAKHSGDPRAAALLEEAIASLKQHVSKMRIPVPGGTMSSYDMMRGFGGEAPLRVLAVQDGAGAAVPGVAPRITETLLNGRPLKTLGSNGTTRAELPFGTLTAQKPNQVVNSGMDNPVNGVPSGWTLINNDRAGITWRDGWIGVHPTGTAWVGIQQILPAGTFPSNALLSLGMNSRLEIESGRTGTGGKVAIHEICPGPNGDVIKLIHENAKNRSRSAARTTTEFRAPSSTCRIRIQLLTYSYASTTTTAWYDDVTLRVADPLGSHVVPAYDLLVHRAPTNTLTLKGTGKVQPQVWDGGIWTNLGSPLELGPQGTDVVIPERFTGRNININYHDGHVVELQLIACLSGERLFDDLALELSRMSASTAYNPANPSRCNLLPLVVEVGEQSVEVQEEPEPLAVQPGALPTTMRLPGPGTGDGS